MAGTWWMAKALLVDASQFGWLVPFSVLGLSALYALWFAVFGMLYWLSRTVSMPINVLRFVILWVAIEWLHSQGMFGFPWNLAGYAALSASIRISQLAAIVGIYGMSFLVLLIALAPVLIIKSQSPKIQVMAGAATLTLLIASYGFGMVRMPENATMSDARVRIVQANIPQAIKWTNEGKLESLELHARLSRLETDGASPPIIIWPESAFPFTLYPDSPWPSRLAALLPTYGFLITGVTRGEEHASGQQLWNSIAVIDSFAQLHATYDKHQLVPFGEFVPLRGLLPMDKITPGAIDFSRGAGAQTLTINGMPSFSPLVCYEAIFPQFTVNKTQRPAWLLNLTNDAWYGNTPGPYQHFTMTRLRAIEQGLPLVRAANSGISAVIDPYGRIVRMLALNVRGVIDQTLPEPLPPTFYARYSDWPLLVVMLALWSWTIWQRKRGS